MAMRSTPGLLRAGKHAEQTLCLRLAKPSPNDEAWFRSTAKRSDGHFSSPHGRFWRGTREDIREGRRRTMHVEQIFRGGSEPTAQAIF
jgi:hypothetical protein